MNIYSENDYRSILKKAVHERKRVDRSCSFQRMAEVMRLQKSYLSRVINGKAELSSDQLFMACEYLEFDERQRSFVFLLLEHSRSQHQKRKQEIQRRIKKVREKNLDSKAHLSAGLARADVDGIEAYYLDPLHQIVHICLSVERYQKDLSLLGADLRLPAQRVHSILQKLEQLGIVAREKTGAVKVLLKNVHLPKESPVFASWRSQLKMLSMHQLQVLPKEKAYSFSVVFSADEATKANVQARFLAFLKEAEAMVKQAPTREVYQMSFDLFPWS